MLDYEIWDSHKSSAENQHAAALKASSWWGELEDGPNCSAYIFVGSLVPSWNRKGKDEDDQNSLLDDLIVIFLLKGLYTYQRWDLRDTEKLSERLDYSSSSGISISPICHTVSHITSLILQLRFAGFLRRDWRDSKSLMWGLLCFRKTNDSGRPLTSITVGNKAELGGCLATLLYLRPPLGRTVVVWILGGGISSPFYSCFLLLLLFWMNELVANRCGSYLQLREKVQKVQVSLCRRQQMLGGRPIPAEQEPPVLHASHPLLQ